ncbi:MAG: hypothetical protein ACJAS9_003811 [Polaribacter sp.]|jgi:hypothetical protein
MPIENWIIMVAVILVSLYPTFFKGKAEAGKLKPRKLLALFGVLTSGFAFLILYSYFTGRFDGDESVAWLVILEICLVGGAIALFGEGYLVKGKYNDKYIEFYTPWSGLKKEKWSTLTEVKHHALNAYYALRFENGTTIRVSDTLVGAPDLVEHLDALGINID